MTTLYLPYKVLYDTEDGYCCEGINTLGEPFGVGAGETLPDAERSLLDFVVSSINSGLEDGYDFTEDLYAEAPPFVPCIVLSLNEKGIS